MRNCKWCGQPTNGDYNGVPTCFPCYESGRSALPPGAPWPPSGAAPSATARDGIHRLAEELVQEIHKAQEIHESVAGSDAPLVGILEAVLRRRLRRISKGKS